MKAKRILAAFIAATMVLSTMSFTAFAEESTDTSAPVIAEQTTDEAVTEETADEVIADDTAGVDVDATDDEAGAEETVTYEAAIGETRYATLAKAIEAAQDDDEINLLTSVDFDGVTIGKTVCLNLGNIEHTNLDKLAAEDGYSHFQKYPGGAKKIYFAPTKAAPKAEVTELTGEELNIHTHSSWGNMTNQDLTLDVGYVFKATDTADEATESQYSPYHADFVVYADKDIDANTIALAGQYDAFDETNWVLLSDAYTAGTKIRLLQALLNGGSINYYELCNTVKEFQCGAMNLSENDALKGTTLTVELRLFPVEYHVYGNTSWNTETDEESILIGSYSYTFGKEYVVGDTTYDSITEAVEAAREKGKAVVLPESEEESAEIPTEVKDVAVTVTTANGTVTFDKESSVSGATVTIAETTENSNEYEISLTDGTVNSATVTMPTDKDETVKVYYLDENGGKNYIEGTYPVENNSVTFTTTHFSVWGTEATSEDDGNDGATVTADLVISTVAELKTFAEDVNTGNTYEGKTVALANDITFDEGDYWWYCNDGTTGNDYRISSFAGTFDGNGYSIKNLQFLYIGGAKNPLNMGLFTTISGEVKNLTLDTVNATIKNTATANRQVIRTSFGFIAITLSGKANNCHVKDVTLNASGRVREGGAMFLTVEGEATDCSATNVKLLNTNENNIRNYSFEDMGGFAGIVKGKLDNCSIEKVEIVADADQSVPPSDTDYGAYKKVGGFIGRTNGANTVVTNCKATNVAISATTLMCYTGGFVGVAGDSGSVDFDTCTIENVNINTTNGRSTQTGGFAGEAKASEFDSCTATTVTIDVGVEDSTKVVGSTAGFCGQTNGGTAGEANVTFKGCEVTNLDMTVAGDLESGIGGFLTSTGGNGNVTIENCSATGSIDATNTNEDDAVGGFLGNLGWGGSTEVTITESSAKVDVTANGDAAGFVAQGSSQSATASATITVESSTATGTVTSENGVAAGFVNSADTGTYAETNTATKELTSTNGTTAEFATAAAGHILEKNENGSYTIRTPQGKVGDGYLAYTTGDNSYHGYAVWGEATNVNPWESLELKLYVGDTVIAATKLNDVDDIINGKTYETLSWHILLAGDGSETTDPYWTTTLTEGVQLWANQLPDKIEMYVDGVLVDTDTDIINGDYNNQNFKAWSEFPNVKGVASIGDVEYATLQEAIDAAEAGGTITLLTDITEEVTVAADDNVTIDLGGKTVTGNFMVNGKATIKNGTINNTNEKKSGVESNGMSADLTTDSLNITSARHALRIDGGVATINGGEYTTTANFSAYPVNAGGDYDSTTVTINGGSFIGGANAAVTGKSAIQTKNGKTTLNINGGTFTSGTETGGQSVEIYGTAKITGGTFNGALVANETTTITGGIFDTNVSKYVAEGYEVTPANGVYTVNNARKYTVTVDDNELVAGDEVTVTVSLTGSELFGSEWTLNYDTGLFKLVEIDGEEYEGDDTDGTFNDQQFATALDATGLEGELRSYTFEALPQSEGKTYTFTLTDAYAQTRTESVQDIKPAPAVETENAKVTIKLDTFDVSALVDNEPVSDNKSEVDYTAKDHTVQIGVKRLLDGSDIKDADVKVTVTLDGEEQAVTLDDNYSFTLTEDGTYTVAYTVSKLGYTEVKGSFTLEIGAPDYEIEVGSEDYVTNKKIVLVYTDSEVVSFKYGNATMLDVSYKGYKYNEKAYTKVYALVVDAVENAADDVYTENVGIVYEELADEYVVTKPSPECDLTGNGTIDMSDVTTAFGVYQVYSDYYSNYMNVVLAADVDGDKNVDGQDTTEYTTEYNQTR